MKKLMRLKGFFRKHPQLKKLRFIFQGLVTYYPFKLPDWVWQHQPQFTKDKVRDNIDYKDLARARYTVWLRFLKRVEPQIKIGSMKKIVEIGPGDCLGIGLCALICGFNEYYPLDKYRRTGNINNLLLLEEIVKLFKQRSFVPSEHEIPGAYPSIESDLFPISDSLLLEFLNLERLEKIKKTVALIEFGESCANVEEIVISYQEPKDVDLLVSVAVLEHVDDPEEVYKKAYSYLKPGGIFAHNIGLNAHGTAVEWNGHWTYSPFVWRLIRGGCKYLINRWPYSWHVSFLEKIGFKITDEERQLNNNQLKRKNLAKKFRYITDDDLETESVFICGFKPKTA